MAEPSRNSNSLTETGIPNGLNRIKTRRVTSSSSSSAKEKDQRRSSGAEDFDKLNDSPNSVKPHVKQKHRVVGKGQVKNNGYREGLKTKKIARWFTTHLSKDSDQMYSNCNFGESRGAMKTVAVEPRAPERASSRKIHKSLKSFSHELGPKGGILSVNPRARSFTDLKELLGSLHSRFDAAKEVVNTELACFSKELTDILQGNDLLSLDGRRMAERLLVLAKKCIKMSTAKFRTKCEKIVQDLTLKRQQCQAGLLKWLLTRMLFILTRCTRLLHFEMDVEPVDGKSLQKFKKCLERIPSLEVNWFLNEEIASSESGHNVTSKNGSVCNLQETDDADILTQQSQSQPEVSDVMSPKDILRTGKGSPSRSSSVLPNDQELYKFDSGMNAQVTNRTTCGSFKEQDQFVDDSNLIICRICEELVPIAHLESHSYICAYAVKCDSNYLDVNERLLRLADLLEQLVDSRNLGAQDTDDALETRLQSSDSAIASDTNSPKVNEPRNRGVEEMFEDLHGMDTAAIEDLQVTSFINSRGYLGSKLNLCGPPSSAGSMTSASSTNTPRAGSFDVFWLDHNNSTYLEDVKQMADLADIARCVAGTDLSEQGSNDFLVACMEDLQEVLQSSKIKALVVDTFGGRIENLLREKFILACNLVDAKGNVQHPETKLILENLSQSSAVSTPSHPSYKDRTSIDDFEIIKPISKGAFGKVYLARKRTTGDLFAIKVLKKVDMFRKNDIDRILAERNILITVRNPFVVRFFYSFTSKDRLYLVMEYLNGGDFYSLLQKVGCLEEEIARIYISELVLALEYLHSLGIVHRDLKPDNILIAHDGHIKLTDFGLSKIGLMNSTSDLTRSEIKDRTFSEIRSDSVERAHRSAVGTPDYLAPEILLGTQHGYAADWWSVGIILFELITGFPPFTAELPEVIFDNILNRFIPWPSIPDEMSNEAQDLIERFLAHDPDQRLGAKGASEVKAHPFFIGVDWDNLALQKAAFVPQPESIDDTSYFVSRYNSVELGNDGDFSDSISDESDSCSTSGLEKLDGFGDLAEFSSSPLDLSLMNFSFKVSNCHLFYSCFFLNSLMA
ncbi:OLC1v1017946C3 [Oldenlandia corymbosa var. corymbosa]|uniref:non-specific serine/threonine protein kinase n=1 Tax=Oldenlandia corymbosa var. corymbosa TaxID=529605 RepID=A0AAV1EAJ5_OLDCO|nr:OLC1v1017946C3 [Oldenlandia corymbosa var. corymbosa]